MVHFQSFFPFIQVPAANMKKTIITLKFIRNSISNLVLPSYLLSVCLFVTFQCSIILIAQLSGTAREPLQNWLANEMQLNPWLLSFLWITRKFTNTRLLTVFTNLKFWLVLRKFGLWEDTLLRLKYVVFQDSLDTKDLTMSSSSVAGCEVSQETVNNTEENLRSTKTS